MPFVDSPNHLARGVVIADALFGAAARLGDDVFAVKGSFSTYILGDLVLASLVKLLGPDHAAPLWMAVAFLSPLNRFFGISN